MKQTPLILFLIGLILVWAGSINGKLGLFLSSLFTPSEIVIKK